MELNYYIETIDLNFWREWFAKEGKLYHYKKGEYFVHSGEHMRYVGWVMSGYFKYTVTDGNFNEHISGFAFPDSFVGDYLGVTRGIASMSDIVAVADTDVLLCRCSVINRLFQENKELHLTCVDALFNQIYTLYLDIHLLSPKERYLALIERCPKILHDISLKELSSFLQITPTHLSRIRKEIVCNR